MTTSFIRQGGRLINVNAPKPSAPTYDYEFVFDHWDVAELFHRAVDLFRQCRVGSRGYTSTSASNLQTVVHLMNEKIDMWETQGGAITTHDKDLRELVLVMRNYANGYGTEVPDCVKEFVNGY
jgi:hypothetical protein